jgi:hypothetical protein
MPVIAASDIGRSITLVHRAVAEEWDRNMRLTTVFEHPRGATCHRRTRTDYAVSAKDTKSDIRDVHRSTTALIVSGFAAH